MKGGRYFIYEITEEGLLKKASLLDFHTEQEAENQIKKMWHPVHPIHLIAVKVHTEAHLIP